MKALGMTSEAIDKGFYLYKNKCKKLGIKNPINKSIFSLLLDGSMQLSQEIVESRLINTNFLILPPGIDIKNDMRVGTIVRVNEIIMSELSFKLLKRYLEIAGDEYSYLIINITQANSFILNGFLFFEKPLQTMISEKEEPLNFHIREKIETFTNAIIISIKDRTVIFSINNENFIRIEKGAFFELPDYSNEIKAAIDVSIGFKNNINKILEFIDGDSIFSFFNIIYLFMKKTLYEIITTIADIKHGATLIFGSKWTINDESIFQPGAIGVNVCIGTFILDLSSKVYNFDEDQFKKSYLEFPYYPIKFTSLKKAIINLSKTDGAVVFNQDLDVIGAGTFIKMTSTVAGEGGARRKSAESFVKANHGTVAIVISQDGMVNSFGPE